MLLKKHLNLQFNTIQSAFVAKHCESIITVSHRADFEMNSCCLYPWSRGVRAQRQTFVKQLQYRMQMGEGSWFWS